MLENSNQEDSVKHRWLATTYGLSRFFAAMLMVTAFYSTTLAALLEILTDRFEMTLRPGLFLPSTVLIGSETLKLGEVELNGDKETKFACANFNGQRTAHLIQDGSGADLKQERIMNPFGSVEMLNLMLREQNLHGSSQSDAELKKSPLLYVRHYDGIGTALLNIWFEDAQKILYDPFWSVLILFPMLLVFSGSVILTRYIVDSVHIERHLLVEPAILFFTYVTFLVILHPLIANPVESVQKSIMAHQEITTLKSDYSEGWLYEFLEGVLVLAVCAFSIRLWRRPLSGVVSRVGIFVVAGVSANLIVNLFFVFVLLVSGTLDLRAQFVDVQEYVPALYERELLILKGEIPDLQKSSLKHLPGWDEACPPWKRYVLP